MGCVEFSCGTAEGLVRACESELSEEEEGQQHGVTTLPWGQTEGGDLLKTFKGVWGGQSLAFLGAMNLPVTAGGAVCQDTCRSMFLDGARDNFLIQRLVGPSHGITLMDLLSLSRTPGNTSRGGGDLWQP